jgi:flagellar motor switch protein FliM
MSRQAAAQQALGQLAGRTHRPVSAFSIDSLERIPRESVEVWQILARELPPYVRSSAMGEAIRALLRRMLAPESADKRTVSLSVRRTDGDASEHSFSEAEVTIGTHAQVMVQLAGAAVSRRHARIVLDERGWCLVDMGSRNGTYLRGERVQSGYAYPLKNGETFAIPGHEVTIRWAEQQPLPVLEELSVSSLRLEDSERFLSGVPAQGLLALVRREPGGERLAIELDLPLAHLLVARLLGEPLPAEGGRAGAGLRPLAEVDRGMLELVLVKLLDEVQAVWGPKAEWTLHLERVLDRRDPTLAMALAPGRMLVVSAGLGFDSRRDSVRAALPVGLVGTLPLLGERAGASIEELFLRYQDQVGLAPVTLRAVVGRARLSQAELAQLNPGDIMVPEELSLHVDAQGLGGRVEFQPVGAVAAGAGGAAVEGRARIAGAIVAFGGGVVQVEVDTIEAGAGAPPANGTSGGSMSGQQPQAGPAGHEEEALGEGAAVLGEVPLPLVVELGRLQLTLRDLAGLRRGQVLELGRGAEEPVHLVLEGRSVGTGRLVNVEGEIGVQIIDLLR